MTAPSAVEPRLFVTDFVPVPYSNPPLALTSKSGAREGYRPFHPWRALSSWVHSPFTDGSQLSYKVDLAGVTSLVMQRVKNLITHGLAGVAG
jgi:hypothetical protein